MKKVLFGLFIIALVIPRIERIRSPNIQIEDPNYIYGAFLILKGQIPFHDFAQPNPPLLEAILSYLYRIFGVSHRIPEILSGFAFLLSAILIYLLASNWISIRAGVLAAILYSGHFLLFRYHLFERETFATLAVLCGLYFISKETLPGAFICGLLLGVGYACKQTALIPFLAVMIVILCIQRHVRMSLYATFGFVLFLGFLTATYTFFFGDAYMRQTFWFHLIKGFVAPWHVKATWSLSGLGYLVPLSIAGLPFMKWTKRDPAWLLLALVSTDLIFFWFVSGAFWPHYLLSTLPPLAILSGAALDRWSDIIIHRSRLSVLSHCFVLTGVAITIAFFLIVPGAMIGKGAAEHYGFSGTPRKIVSECATFIRDHTSPDDVIIAEPFIALEAQRQMLVKFYDNWGLILWMNQMLDQGTYFHRVKELSKQKFGDIRKYSQQFWMPLVDTAFAQKTIAAIQPNYELPLSDDVLAREGFTKGFSRDFITGNTIQNFTVWIRDSSLK